MRLRVLHAPKRPDAPEEYEDAAWPSRAPEVLTLPLRIAVADGATTSSFSGLWARHLVCAWAEKRLNRDSLLDDVTILARQWRQEVGNAPLPWFAQEKARQGAHAALIGLSVEPDGSWAALAIGDCCLFVIRENILIEAFPARHPEALEHNPYLIGTDVSPALDEVAREAFGFWQQGDILLLMSDALARWFLESAVAREQTPWKWLASLDSVASPRAFEAMLRPLRNVGQLQSDDVTLMMLDL
ncbi:MAG: protein phosphatase 2C domain-containing protein [Armatimonas sp.]